MLQRDKGANLLWRSAPPGVYFGGAASGNLLRRSALTLGRASKPQAQREGGKWPHLSKLDYFSSAEHNKWEPSLLVDRVHACIV